jgi:hypothetical protein
MHYQSNNFLNYIHASKLLSNGRQFYSSRILLIKGRALVLNGLIIKAMKRIIHVAWKDTSIDYLIWHVLKLFLLQIKRNSQLYNLVGRSTVARLAGGNHRPRDKLVNTAPPLPSWLSHWWPHQNLLFNRNQWGNHQRNTCKKSQENFLLSTRAPGVLSPPCPLAAALDRCVCTWRYIFN